MNMTNQTGSMDVSDQSSLFSQASESSSPLIGFIDTSIVLLKLDGSFYVCDLNKMMAEYISTSLAQFREKEEVSGPLLISEPFKISKGKIDNHFEDLKNLGFELDRLNSEVIALRTLPRFVPQALSRDITNTLINFFDQAKNREYSLDQVNLFLEANYPKVFSIPEHLIVLIVERLHQAKGSSLVLLSEKNVKGLLK